MAKAFIVADEMGANGQCVAAAAIGFAFVLAEIPVVGLADSLSTGDHFDELSKRPERPENRPETRQSGDQLAKTGGQWLLSHSALSLSLSRSLSFHSPLLSQFVEGLSL